MFEKPLQLNKKGFGIKDKVGGDGGGGGGNCKKSFC